MENVESTVSNGSTQEFELTEYLYEKTPVLAGILATHEVVAVKPLCENIGIDYTWQWRKIKEDSILNQLLLKEKVLTNGKNREMICFGFAGLQEWLWSIKPTENTNVQLLDVYKKGLVLFLIQALGLSLARIKELEEESLHWQKQYNVLAENARQMIEADDLGKEKTKEAKDYFKKSNELKHSILDSLSTQQLQLTF